MYTKAVEWLVETGYVAEGEKQFLLDAFDARSQVIAGYDPARGAADLAVDRIATKNVGAHLPVIATVRQRQVRVELGQHYRKARGSEAQGVFLAVMNLYLQSGTPRLEAERKVVKSLRLQYPGFSPLRAEPPER
jgi:hypothetical protein